VDALLRDDRDQARGLALQHLHASGSRLAVFADLLHPAQDRLAELWYQSRISAAAEGRAASTVLAITRRLPPTPGPGRSADSRCLLTALPDEAHTLGLEMLAAALEDDGWAVQVSLGHQPRQLVELVRSIRPRFVGLTAGSLDSAAPVGTLIEALRAVRVPVLVGGQAFNRTPHLWRRLGATGRAPDLRVGLVLARRTLGARAGLRAGAA